ncbi:hypothetical protein INT47_004503 [Mucor saturninus]|uniref:Zinc finger CCCH domain-containing protein 14 n=1 Tax=Mucor saturninus TaxID=64648 RepID=A0A8H7RIU3_9FUNG|nr:hypothetical protein INT47_004503 [Mucor saturninus]
MQPELLVQLKNEIHSKCVAYDYNDAADNTLSDFIINLIQVDKSAEEVNNELLSLVGSDYDSNLTQWIFERKKQLEDSQSTVPIGQQQQHEEPQQREEGHQLTQESESMDITPKLARHDRDNRMFSKAIGSVIGHGNRSERSYHQGHSEHSRARSRSPVRRSSRSPGRDSSRYEQDRYSSRHDDQRPSRQEDDRNKASIFSRVGRSSTSTVDREDDRPSVFDRLGGAKPIIAAQTKHDSKKERCKYWPNCKNGDECVYFHPTTVCPDFPNCPKKAIECMFIHPEIAKPVVPQQIKKLPVPCRFFPYCSNPVCPFVHPTQPFFMQAKPSFATTGQRVQIPCKNGDNCTRPDCHFLHPKDPNPQSDIICKFDGACTRHNCFYKHTKENSPNKVFIPDNTNSRQFSVAEDEVVERIVVGNSADMITSQDQSFDQPSTTDMDSDVVMDAN